VLTANTVSPSYAVWTGRMLRATPSWATSASRWACALVRVTSVATTTSVVFVPVGGGGAPSARSRPTEPGPATTEPSSATTSPTAFTATRAATVPAPGSRRDA